jgi:hypothetical protein
LKQPDERRLVLLLERDHVEDAESSLLPAMISSPGRIISA